MKVLDIRAMEQQLSWAKSVGIIASYERTDKSYRIVMAGSTATDEGVTFSLSETRAFISGVLTGHGFSADSNRINATDPNAWPRYSDHPFEDWQAEAAAGDTRLGYEDWRQHQLEAQD